MIEITILGTACMQPTKERNHLGILLKYKNESLLFDCGEGIQRQLKIANFRLPRLTRVFISHWHGDHVLGLPGLMNSLATDQYSSTFKIYGPPGTKQHIHSMLKTFLSKFVIDYEVFEVWSSQVLETEDFFVQAQPLKHGLPCLGYSFIEKDRRKIKPAYIKKIPGLLLGQLQKGQAVTHQNKKITPKEATYLVKGKKVSFIADTRPCPGFLKLAHQADLLISEATYLERDQAKAEEYLHLTAREVALLAHQAQVKKLVLLHFSQRYKDVREIREEVTAIFPNSVCAEDFMKFKL